MVHEAVLKEKNGIFWITSTGEILQSVGSMEHYAGEHVWTDGIIIYGYTIPSIVHEVVRKAENGGIMFAVHPDTSVLAEPDDWYSDYLKIEPIVSYVYVDTYDVKSKVTRAPAWQYVNNMWDCACIAGKLLFCYKNNDTVYMSDNQGNAVTVASATNKPALIAGSAGGKSAWLQDESNNSKIHVLNEDLSVNRTINLTTIQSNIARNEEYDDGEGNSLVVNRIYRETRYPNNADGSGLSDIRFVGETFACSFKLELRCRKYTDYSMEEITIYKQVFINGSSIDVYDNETIADITMGDGVYNGYSKTMQYKYIDEQEIEHTVTIPDVEVNFLLQKIGGFMYLYKPYLAIKPLYVAPIGDSTMRYAYGASKVNVLPLQKAKDVKKFTAGWSYIPPEEP